VASDTLSVEVLAAAILRLSPEDRARLVALILAGGAAMRPKGTALPTGAAPGADSARPAIAPPG